MSNVQQSAVAPSTLTATLPRFLSRGHTYRAVVGDTLVLPCQVENLVPPSVRAIPTSGQLQARKGGPITLECKGSGNPVPSIYWTKKSGANKSTARIGDGPILTLEKLERQQAGVYQCTADNGVGDPVTVDMRLDVLYPPDIQVEKSWIHSGEGFEAKLVCIVYADPVATLLQSIDMCFIFIPILTILTELMSNPNLFTLQVSWYQNSFPIQSTDRRVMNTRANRHTLSIRHIQQEDFGNYSCVADNSLGRSRKYMELSGRPGPAEFYSPKWGRSPDSYNLTWKIDSYPPLEEVRLLYRRVLMNDTYQQPGRWHDFILTPEHRPASEPLTHIMSYTIKNLHPGAYYEAIVQAKNRYGWNEVSDIFQFIVANEHQDIAPEDAEVVASSKSRSNSASVGSLPGSLPQSLLLHTALLLALALSNCQFDRRRLGLG
ncbi:hypothetical protein M5D96_000142 [Drosophila gunungcola]|uniref:Uncharacterized protein n=1 Tax=Drosophila gunungcola TaxID=103775 RepID=A0A9P9YWJ9_9MUSC|nr:hypothetical protein M5D96_000142 [Drosophila gunungcola]